MARRRMVVALAVLLVPFAGCLGLDVAHVPDRLLTGPQGNGWLSDPDGSSDGARGFSSRSAQRAYVDDARNGEGYPARLLVVSFRSLVSPNTEALAQRTRDFLEAQSEEQGYTLQGESAQGRRSVAGGRPSQYFVFAATATSESPFFSTGSTIRVLGEVFRCPSGTDVIVAATAQVNRVRTIGGVITTDDPDDSNWAEVVADPSGSVNGKTGRDGLVHNIQC